MKTLLNFRMLVIFHCLIIFTFLNFYCQIFTKKHSYVTRSKTFCLSTQFMDSPRRSIWPTTRNLVSRNNVATSPMRVCWPHRTRTSQSFSRTQNGRLCLGFCYSISIRKTSKFFLPIFTYKDFTIVLRFLCDFFCLIYIKGTANKNIYGA